MIYVGSEGSHEEKKNNQVTLYPSDKKLNNGSLNQFSFHGVGFF